MIDFVVYKLLYETNTEHFNSKTIPFNGVINFLLALKGVAFTDINNKTIGKSL
jgi:hypothetical protein